MTVDDGDGSYAASPCGIRFDADLPGFDRSRISSRCLYPLCGSDAGTACIPKDPIIPSHGSCRSSSGNRA